MAVDTKTKRLSMMNFGSHAETLPEPSSGFDAADRSHLLDLYAMAGATLTTGPFHVAAVALYSPGAESFAAAADSPFHVAAVALYAPGAESFAAYSDFTD